MADARAGKPIAVSDVLSQMSRPKSLESIRYTVYYSLYNSHSLYGLHIYGLHIWSI